MIPTMLSSPVKIPDFTADGRECAPPEVGEMVWEDLRLKDILTKQSFENAIIADLALGGSTNAIVHVLAMAHRAGADITHEDFDR